MGAEALGASLGSIGRCHLYKNEAEGQGEGWKKKLREGRRVSRGNLRDSGVEATRYLTVIAFINLSFPTQRQSWGADRMASGLVSFVLPGHST